MFKKLVTLVAAASFGFAVSAQSTDSSSDKAALNEQLRTMVSGYFGLDCAASDKILIDLNREDLNAAMGILDLRAKCYADSGEQDKAVALAEAMERAYPESFEAASAAYYVTLKTGDEDAAAEARKTLLGRHAVLEVKNPGGDHLFLRERVRIDDKMIEVREDLAFLKNGLYGMRYQFRVLEGQIPKHIFVLGSSRAAEGEIKEAIEDKTDQRYFHLDYFGEDQDLGPLKIYTRLPSYEPARDAVVEYVKNGVTPDDFFDDHATLAKFQYKQ